jgi:hypothetical protein
VAGRELVLGAVQSRDQLGERGLSLDRRECLCLGAQCKGTLFVFLKKKSLLAFPDLIWRIW